MKWIKHDTDANQDAKLQNVLIDYGLEGYGLYWYCIELIAGKIDVNNLTFELEHDARIIARHTGSTQQKVEEMMKYFVSQGLFECSDNTITCLKLSKRLNQSMTSNPQMRNLIGKLGNHDKVMTPSCPNHDEVMQDKIRLDKNRKEYKRVTKADKSATPTKKFIKPSTNEIHEYMKGKGVNDFMEAEKFFDYWESVGWLRGRTKMKCWKASVRTWLKNYKPKASNSGPDMSWARGL